MATLTLRNTKGSPLTSTELDNNFTNLNADIASRLSVSSLLSSILAIDGSGSGIDADLLDGLNSSSTNVASTVVTRDTSGNFAGGVITGVTLAATTAVTTPLLTVSAGGSASIPTLTVGTLATITTLSATSNITSPAATITALTVSGALTGSTAVMNIGNGQVYKDTSGNLGIATTTPTNSAGYGSLSLSGTTGGQLAFQTSGVIKQNIYSDSTNLQFNNSVSGGSLIFLTNGAEQVRLNGSGNLGVGTNAPVSKMHVVGSAGVTALTGTVPLGFAIGGSTAANDYSGIDFLSSYSTPTAPKARIAVLTSAGGSYLQLGTSNNYVGGITNTALSIDPSGNTTINGTLTLPNAPLAKTSGGTGTTISTRQIAQISVTNYTAASAAITTVIPLDATIPQNTEGVQIMTATITPTSASSTLEIEVLAWVCITGANNWLALALFRDAGVNAITSALVTNSNGWIVPMMMKYYVPSTATTATTFNVRLGPNANTAYLNTNGTTAFHGTLNSYIKITEYLA